MYVIIIKSWCVISRRVSKIPIKAMYQIKILWSGLMNNLVIFMACEFFLVVCFHDTVFEKFKVMNGI